MKEIILTGYNKKQFHEILEKEESGGCYLCKRQVEGVFMVKEGEEEGMGSIKLEFRWFEVIEDNQKFMYALCDECHKLLKGFVEKLLFQKEFGREFKE